MITTEIENYIEKKLLEAATEFTSASVRFQAWDNSDDMHDMEQWEAAFNFVAKDSDFEGTSVETFVALKLPNAVKEAIKSAQEDVGEKIDKDTIKQIKENFGVK